MKYQKIAIWRVPKTIFFVTERFSTSRGHAGPTYLVRTKKRFLVVARLSAHPQARLPSPYSQIPAPEARATTQARFPSRYCSRSTRSRRRRTPIWAPRRKLLCCPRHRPAPTHTRRCHRFGCCPRRAAIGTAAASRGHRCTHNESATFGGFAQVTIAEEGCRSDSGDAAALYDIVNAYRPVRLASQVPASSTFLSEQTSHQQPANSTFL
jgi:hypothetical protein